MIQDNFTTYDFKLGDNNPSVKFLQRSLRESVNTNLKIDGQFGDSTVRSLKLWQQKIDLSPTGFYNGETRDILNKYINKRFIQEWCYAAVALAVGRDTRSFTAISKAIASVESRAEGFTSDGSVQLLFERHKFKSQLQKRLTESAQDIVLIEDFYKTTFTGNKVSEAVAFVEKQNPNICNSKAGGYLVGASEQKRFELAMSINPTAATESASFGLYQIMGFNAKHCGYDDGYNMLKSFMEGEYYHLMALGNFLEANSGIYTYLKNGNYEAIARLYNGPAYAKNNYHVKIRKALSVFGY